MVRSFPNGLHAEGWYRNLGAKVRYISFEAAPIYYNPEGNLIAAIETVQDLTRLKQMEETLQEYTGDLEREVRERTEELETARMTAEDEPLSAYPEVSSPFCCPAAGRLQKRTVDLHSWRILCLLLISRTRPAEKRQKALFRRALFPVFVFFFSPKFPGFFFKILLTFSLFVCQTYDVENNSAAINVNNLPLIGTSQAVKRIYELSAKVANCYSTVLIMGESGTGKELVAKNIHYKSNRAEKPFIPVNCGAIPSELLESELFGHEKGAFTGAVAMRIGRFELADSGTIFLDEIGEMPPILQVKLLRVIQERSFERIGGTRTVNVDVRIIAATNRNLEEAVKEGKFREDLYYRLNVIPVEIPPLRERIEDIPLLCDFFIEKHAKRFGRSRITLSEDTIKIFHTYAWPGNVRELENTIERLLVLKDNDIVTPFDLPERMTGRRIPDLPEIGEEDANPFIGGIDLNAALEEYERRLILHALELHNGVKSQAARYLNINRTTLIEKMKRLILP